MNDEINTPFGEELSDRFRQIDRRFEEGSESMSQQLSEQRAYTEFACERFDRAFQAVSAGIARLERKLDRILALATESRARSR
jgi:hypothetical protein